MKGKILLLTGVAGLIYLASRAKQIKETVKFLEWSPAGIGLKFEGLVPILLIKLNIYNPNRSSVPVNGILGKIYFKGQPLVNFVNEDRLVINGAQTGQVTIRARLSLFSTAVALFQKDPFKKIEIDGLIKTSVTDIPFGYAYDFTTGLASKLANLSGMKKTPFINAFGHNNHSFKRSA